MIGGPHLSNYAEQNQSDQIYYAIAQVLRREYSVFLLSPDRHLDPHEETHGYRDLCPWFLSETNPDRVLDAVELTFRAIETFCAKKYYRGRANASNVAAEAVKELNIRFNEHGVGYQFSDGQIVRVDSQLIHKEAVLPALAVLRAPEFANAQREFFSAFDHFRHGRKQEALVDCYKCFESTMKVICGKRRWEFDTRASASDLVRICFDNGLIPSYWQAHFAGLRSVLESAISTPRNRQAGHGAGSGSPPEIPNELVSYVLHMTAATVLFLSESEKRLSA